MITTLLDYWVGVFAEELRDNTKDELKLLVVKKAPFQDDPTRKVPYLIIDVDSEKGIMPDPDWPAEVGGALRWRAYLKIRAAPKVVSSVDRAYHLTEVLQMRICYLLRTKAYEQPTAPNGSFMSNASPLVIDKIVPKMSGGEKEWLPHVDIFFHSSIDEPRSIEAFAYGTYPGTI